MRLIYFVAAFGLLSSVNAFSPHLTPRIKPSSSAAIAYKPNLATSIKPTATPRHPPVLNVVGPLSLLPPITTLAAAIWLRSTFVAMLLGIWTGACLLTGDPVSAILRTFDGYVLSALADPEHAGVILFTTVLGGTIGLVQKSGGALGLATLVKGFFTSRQAGALSSIGLGSLVFFDDYSSILIVGNSLRPLLQAVRLSAAKFAYIAHTIGVCLAALSPLSSWVGIQIGYIAGAYSQLGGESILGNVDPFLAFLTTIPMRYFPLSMLAFVVFGAFTGRDFGPMLAAEREALAETAEASSPAAAAAEAEATAAAAPVDDDGEELAVGGDGALDPAAGTPLRARNALLPFSMVLLASFSGMVFQGLDVISGMEAAVRPEATLVNALRYADSVSALIWGSVGGWIVSTVLVLQQKILDLNGAMGAWVEGAKEVLEPTFVLVLAWALGSVIADVGTADYLAGALQSGLPQWGLPALVSLLCYVISFACGSSIGTMGIVFPLVGPLAMRLSGGDLSFLHQCFGSIMGGSIFGNLCSPLSDTTILTVLATRCELPTHIGTCIGYTAIVGLVALLFGDLAVGIGVYGPVTALGVCFAILFGIKRFAGVLVEEDGPEAGREAAAAAPEPAPESA